MWIFGAAYFGISALLLLNMLIAMMAKSFDDASGEQQRMNYQWSRAQTILSFAEQHAAPSPLYLLTLPRELIMWFVSTFCMWFACTDAWFPSTRIVLPRCRWLT